MGIDDLIRALKALPDAQPTVDAGTCSDPPSELLSVLREAAGGARDVPPGWHRLQRDAQRMLQSAADAVESRRELRVTSLYVLGSRPVVRLSTPDPVVHGIYRRTLARARHTCQICGRAGRAWDCLSQLKVLCARCAAPHAVATDLDALQALRDRQRRTSHDAPVAELPARLAATVAARLLQSHDSSNGQDAPPAQSVRPITRDDFERWCEWLLALRDDPHFSAALDSVR